jgi:hypothetical protein
VQRSASRRCQGWSLHDTEGGDVMDFAPKSTRSSAPTEKSASPNAATSKCASPNRVAVIDSGSGYDPTVGTVTATGSTLLPFTGASRFTGV